MYAIVDLETTGGYASRHRIIEVAVILHDGEKITDRYETLVNPGKPVPLHISALTGITTEMVEQAPDFAEVAGIIDDMTRDRIFVAHNVHFDYSFLKQEMGMADLSFQRKRLCTVRLSRKLIPGLPSYRLSTICDMTGIGYKDKHRAMSDAEAATRLLETLHKRDEAGIIEKALKHNSREATLPANLPREQFEALPDKAGVYYFTDNKGKVVYVGKARNIRSRVAGHFNTEKTGWQKQNFMRVIHGVDYEITGNELTALLLEAHQIKKLWPVFNKAQKQASRWLGIVAYEDRAGFMRLGIHKMRRPRGGVYHCHSMSEARHFLWTKVSEFGLCAKMSGLHQGEGPCRQYEDEACSGACVGKVTAQEYNKMVEEAIASMKVEQQTYAILGAGRHAEEQSVVLVEEGHYRGFGYLNGQASTSDLETLKQVITARYDSPDSRNIIEAHLRKNTRDRVLVFE